MEKRFMLAVMIVLVLMTILLTSSSQEYNKAGEEIVRALEKQDEIHVVVELEDLDKSFSIKTPFLRKALKQVIEEEKENMTQDLGNRIALTITKEQLERLEQNNNIRKISLDKNFKLLLQQSIPKINASTVWPIKLSGLNITGVDQTVCIIDTGINFTHPDLQGMNKTCVIDCYQKACVENCSVQDDNGHGTHVAGIVGANGGIQGVAINVSLIGLKVLDASGNGYGSDVEAAMNWCIANRDNYNITVISMSMGITNSSGQEIPYNDYCDDYYTSDFTFIINNATLNNISVVIATGNDLGAGNITAPACIYNATAVGAVNDADTLIYNRNSITDLVAPGYMINSTRYNNGLYIEDSGTSMATPHVSGAFALINEFYKLQYNRSATPLQIRSILRSGADRVYDPTSGLNFSRLNLYQSLIDIDDSGPEVALSSPGDSSSQFENNISFNCSANDVKLQNLTLYVWNDTGIYNTTLIKTNSTNILHTYNLYNMQYGSYKWNCLAYDHDTHFSFADANYTLYVGNITAILNYPINNTYTNQNLSFNCSADTEPAKQLSNITFFIWNSSDNLLYNETKNVSGTNNGSIFSFNFTLEDEYTWACLAINNHSEDAMTDNYSVTYDDSSPEVSLLSPSNGASYDSNSQTITFSFNASDPNPMGNCSLIVNNALQYTSSDINDSQVNSFSKTLTPGTYSWNINCTDLAGNQANSSQRTLTINAVEDSGGSSGGGGGGGSAIMTYIANQEQLQGGYTKNLRINDRIRFEKNLEQHTATLKSLTLTSATVAIESDPISVTLTEGQEIKLDLEDDNYYDIFIRLNDIVLNRANLTIQSINEEIISEEKQEINFTAFDDNKNVSDTDTYVERREAAEVMGKANSEIDKNVVRIILFTIFITLAIIVSLVILIVFFLMKKKNKRTRKKHENEATKTKP